MEEVLLTGSGGPFRGLKAADLAAVTPERALAHPTWAMGPKITVDSATLMNKGLEVIEAHYLFAVPYDRITVVLDPQSIVHSMVRFVDGAILAHLGVPDMRTPIGYALAYPQRPPLPMVRRLDLLAGGISFDKPDTATFRCLALAYQAGKAAAAATRGRGRRPRTVHHRCPRGAQRRQRGRRGGVPGGAPRRSPASPRSSRSASPGWATSRCGASTTSTPAMRRPAASRARRRAARRDGGGAR